MEYTVNGHTIRYLVQGETKAGDDYCLLNTHQDLTAGTGWSEKGYTIEPLFEKGLYATFQQEAIALLFRCWKSAGLMPPENFNPEWYHTIIPDQQTHLRAVEQTKLLTTDRFPVDIRLIEERISALCAQSLIAENPFDNQQLFHFRVIRPHSGDNNPLHRDAWLEDYSDCINLYFPIAGSNALSSLILATGSHHWKESRIEMTTGGALINGQKFNVPAVARILGPYELVRPDPKPNEVLIFSPYLVHGGAVNLNTDITRISIELRLWKKWLI
jgi:hypothetical protein